MQHQNVRRKLQIMACSGGQNHHKIQAQTRKIIKTAILAAISQTTKTKAHIVKNAPFLPFYRPDLDEENLAAVNQTLREGWKNPGQCVRDLEAALSARYGHRPVRVASSASASVEFALRIAGIGVGDEVIASAFSWVGSVSAILKVGAVPVLVDVDPYTGLMDLNRVAPAITPHTRAILSIDMAGIPVERLHLYSIAMEHRLRVIEDAVHAMGASSHGTEIGSNSDLVIFSFQLNACASSSGGGCLVMNDENEASIFECLRNNGIIEGEHGHYDVACLHGSASMLSDPSAIVALSMFRKLDERTAKRRDIARHYFSALNDMPLVLPPAEFTQSSWHRFHVLLPESCTMTREEVVHKMQHEHQIQLGPYYPPIHHLSLFQQLGYKAGDFPIAESFSRRMLSLPMFASMTMQDTIRVASALQTVLAGHG